MDRSRKARAKYHINNIIFQVMMSGPSGFMQDLNSSQNYYLGLTTYFNGVTILCPTFICSEIVKDWGQILKALLS